MYYNKSKQRPFTEQEVKQLSTKYGHRYMLNFLVQPKQRVNDEKRTADKGINTDDSHLMECSQQRKVKAAFMFSKTCG